MCSASAPGKEFTTKAAEFTKMNFAGEHQKLAVAFPFVVFVPSW